MALRDNEHVIARFHPKVAVRCGWLLLLAGALCGCATYQRCGLFGCRGDRAINVAVQAMIRKYPALEAPNVVRVHTIDHVVYLYGQVSTELQRSMAGEAALSVNGVTRVVNSINLEYEGR